MCVGAFETGILGRARLDIKLSGTPVAGKNIKGRFTPGLAALLQLQPIRHEYKPDNALGLPSGGEAVGFSAEAVEQVLPEAVSRTPQGYLQVNSDPILWTMLTRSRNNRNSSPDNKLGSTR